MEAPSEPAIEARKPARSRADGADETLEASPPARSRWRGHVLRTAGALALLAALAWTFRGLDVGSVWRGLTGARRGWLVVAALLNLGAIAFQAGRWVALLRPLSRVPTLASAFKAMVVGFAVSTVVPARAGEVARVQWMARRTGLPRASIAGSIVLDYLVNAAGLLAGLVLLPFVVAVPPWIRNGIILTLALFALAALLVMVARPTGSAASASEPKGWIARVLDALSRARHGLTATSDPKAIGASLASSLASWAVELCVIALTIRAMGIRAPLAASFLALLAVNLALAFPFAPPANLGTLEVGATLALVSFGVPKEQALAFGIVYHLLQIVPVGLLGVFFAGRADPPARLKGTSSTR